MSLEVDKHAFLLSNQILFFREAIQFCTFIRHSNIFHHACAINNISNVSSFSSISFLYVTCFILCFMENIHGQNNMCQLLLCNDVLSLRLYRLILKSLWFIDFYKLSNPRTTFNFYSMEIDSNCDICLKHLIWFKLFKCSEVIRVAIKLLLSLVNIRKGGFEANLLIITLTTSWGNWQVLRIFLIIVVAQRSIQLNWVIL